MKYLTILLVLLTISCADNFVADIEPVQETEIIDKSEEKEISLSYKWVSDTEIEVKLSDYPREVQIQNSKGYVQEKNMQESEVFVYEVEDRWMACVKADNNACYCWIINK